MAADMSLVRPETLRFQVENVLRQAIIDGRFAPGERLIERELCASLGVSRTSIREALRKLEAEKLVTIVANKGPMVASLSVKEAADLLALRGLLEGFIAREFSQSASAEELAEFAAAVAQLHAAVVVQDHAGYLLAEKALYHFMLARCDNQLLKESLTGLHLRLNLLPANLQVPADRLAESLQEIEFLYQAIAARDGEAAEKAARWHMTNARQAVLQSSGK